MGWGYRNFILFFISLLSVVTLKLYLNTFDLDDCTLAVGVLSARNHFSQRSVIRQTWWNNAIGKNSSFSDKVHLRFVVGDTSCKYPITDRIDDTLCSFWNVSYPDKTNNMELLHWVPLSETDTSSCLSYPRYEFSFKVLHPVIITKLGVVAALFTDLTSVHISLLDVSSQVEVVSTVIEENDSDGTMTYRSVQPYLLPKGFEGSLRVHGVTEEWMNWVLLQGVHYHTPSDDGVIHVYQEQSLQKRTTQHSTEACKESAPVVSIMYDIHDVTELSVHIQERKTRLRKHQIQIEQETNLLLNEQEQFQDLLMVDVVDVYRYLPGKLLQFFSWVSSGTSCSFVLKTDDDCYVDIERILNVLNKWKDQKKVWWGRFRHNWAVMYHGKWAERQYPATAYPDFACGSGYVLSKDLVDWLSANHHHLHHYQGEDTSLGIWLAAVNPEYRDDPLWQCKEECISEMFSAPDLTPDIIRMYWRNRETCQDPCGC